MPIFSVPDQELKLFEMVIKEYFQFLKQKPESDSKILAESGVKNLLEGKLLDGSEPSKAFEYFDELVSLATENFYAPTTRQRFRFLRNDLKKEKKKKGSPIASSRSSDNQDKFENIKNNLLSEYPFLDRVDLQDAINNYCLLIVRVNQLLENGEDSSNLAIKNLTETQIKLGQYLGISESDRQKMKQAGDKDSVASLSIQFQQTLDEMPEIYDRFRFQELKVLLQKYDRQELSRELFELPAFAGVPIESARVFVKEREGKYS